MLGSRRKIDEAEGAEARASRERLLDLALGKVVDEDAELLNREGLIIDYIADGLVAFIALLIFARLFLGI